MIPLDRGVMLTRRTLLGAGLAALASTTLAKDGSEDLGAAALKAIENGLTWLLKQQGEDGGWHSETYGALRQGAAVTSLVIYTLSHLPPVLRKSSEAAARKGFAFLEPGLAKRGYIACPDGSLDYPTYATALVVSASRSFDFGLKPDIRGKLVAWIASGQLHETREFTQQSPHYGGWDLMGASQVKGLTSDTTVSNSCYALEALHDAQGAEVAKTLARARNWALRCQDIDGDGGFWFSPDPMSINHKAGFQKEDNKKPRTYGSSTCDGLRCLLYTGDDAPEKRVATAVKWLVDHPEVNYVPGFDDPEDLNGWAMGLRFYYYQSLAKLLTHLPKKAAAERRVAIIEKLVKLQQRDGRWQNESSRMREDDPIIATCLALIALSVLTSLAP